MIQVCIDDALSFNGKTSDFGSDNVGSIPTRAVKYIDKVVLMNGKRTKDIAQSHLSGNDILGNNKEL